MGYHASDSVRIYNKEEAVLPVWLRSLISCSWVNRKRGDLGKAWPGHVSTIIKVLGLFWDSNQSIGGSLSQFLALAKEETANYKWKRNNFVNNLREFASESFCWATRWEYSPADTFIPTWWGLWAKNQSVGQKHADVWPTEIEE